MPRLRPRDRAFTLIELAVAVAVLALLSAMAVPAYNKARFATTESACAKNRGVLDQAKLLWMIDNGKNDESEVLFMDLLPEYVAEPPVCPLRGHYALNGLKAGTSCTVHGE